MRRPPRLPATLSRRSPPGSLSCGRYLERLQAAAELLARYGAPLSAGSADGEVPVAAELDALATALMDLYRKTGSAEVFEALVQVSHDQLLRRVRARTRYLGDHVPADELLQDALINIFRYPDRFDSTRPGAFKAWASTIVDNAIRRHLRRSQAGQSVNLRPVEALEQEPDRRQPEPGQRAMDKEACQRAAAGYRVFLALYLHAYETLRPRERFVLQMVEVRGLRYAELARALGIRPEALKMVVFRARRRILARIAALLPSERPAEPQGSGASAEPLRRRAAALAAV
jgi:RNA polymerase sigma-70 factor (ECF subfamily)